MKYKERACEYCGCTEYVACPSPFGPCSWVSLAPPVCSAPDCVRRWKKETKPETKPRVRPRAKAKPRANRRGKR